jgi:hypothetical protein
MDVGHSVVVVIAILKKYKGVNRNAIRQTKTLAEAHYGIERRRTLCK